MGVATSSTSSAAARSGVRTAFSALSVPGFAPLWFSGALWNVSRWGIAFLSAYLVREMTDSARLVQLTGSAMWAPLLGGVIGGVVADRFDRRRTVLIQMIVLAPLTALIGIAAATDTISLWMIYAFLVVVGVGWVVDMTSRRSLVYDVVGVDELGNAMALESMSLSGGIALGTLLGGTVVSLFGVGAAYLGVAVLLAVALVSLLRVPPVAPLGDGVPARPVEDLREGFRLARVHRPLLSILGVTVAVNFFYFAYFPLVQVVADELGVGAALTGLLASATGLGMMTGSMVMAAWQPRQRGLAYVAGASGGMALMLGFAVADVYLMALALLLASSVATGFFASTQAALVMTSVPDEVRGRAMGLLSMAIGALPVGMFVLGESAERFGTTTALLVSNAAGLVAMALWQWWRPEARRIVV